MFCLREKPLGKHQVCVYFFFARKWIVPYSRYQIQLTQAFSYWAHFRERKVNVNWVCRIARKLFSNRHQRRIFMALSSIYWLNLYACLYAKIIISFSTYIYNDRFYGHWRSFSWVSIKSSTLRWSARLHHESFSFVLNTIIMSWTLTSQLKRVSSIMLSKYYKFEFKSSRTLALAAKVVRYVSLMSMTSHREQQTSEWDIREWPPLSWELREESMRTGSGAGESHCVINWSDANLI